MGFGVWRVGLVVALLGLSCPTRPARADDITLPGLDRDVQTYITRLTSRFPAGGTPQARAAAEAQIAASMQAKNWAAEQAALETRIALGQPSPLQWLELAEAALLRNPPDARTALLAGWQSYQLSTAGKGEIPGLIAVADALRVQNRPALMVQALRAALSRDPDDAHLKQEMADGLRLAGMIVSHLRVEGEADPPRACVSFTIPPVHRPDFNPQDWVTLSPPVADVAVTREGDDICVSGLPSGATTKLTLRAGLPGTQGMALKQAASLAIAMPNRKPRIAFDTRLFILPHGQSPAVTLTTINLSAVSLQLIRLTQRNVSAFLASTKLGQPIDVGTASQLADSAGSVVWRGKAEIPKWQANKPARTALPIPDALTGAGPGLYALVVQPGDGTSTDAAGGVQMILSTDLAPTLWRGSDGLTVQLRGYSDARPRAGVKLRLVAVNNDILGETVTDADGFGRFPAPLLHGAGSLAPAALHAFAPDGDFAAMDLSVAAFDLSDRGVGGQPDPGPLDAYVWLDRGIYRPGETVQVMALLRDAAGEAADIPAELRVLRPNGQVFLKITPPRGPGASIHLPVLLSAGAPAGTWTIELRADPAAAPIGRASFRVDAFVPDRMAVDLGPAPAAIVPGTPTSLPVAARFLYGAPGSGLSGTATLHLVVDPTPFADFAAYHIGLIDETYAPDAMPLVLPDTDAKGQASLPITLARAPDTTQALKASIDVVVNDPAGHGSRATISIPVRGANPYIGIRSDFPDDAVDADTPATFDIVALDPEGKRIAMPAKLRLVREQPDWHMVMTGSVAQYQTVWRDEPLQTQSVIIPAGKPLHFSQTLGFGRYRLEVSQDGGMATSSVRFRSGWAENGSPDVPDKVDVSADRRVVPAGQNVTIHIAPPFAGQATLLLLTDKVLSHQVLSVPAGGADVSVPVSAAWGPGAYVAVHVFRGGTGADGRTGEARRAVGLVWVGVDPAARDLKMAIDVPAMIRPRTHRLIAVTAAPGAWVSLAVVDEGILRLTRFVSPDPVPHFLGRRSLGIDIRDDWGRLLPPAEGDATLLRQGGDEGAFVLPNIPQRTVTLFVPPVQAGADGRAMIPLDMPDFEGQVRLMAVAWEGSRIGAANADLTVRDPLVAEELLPRFLAPGDTARMAVLLHNLDLPAGVATANISVSGPLALAGPASLSATLAVDARALPSTALHATGAGQGVVHIDVTGPGGFHVSRSTDITIRPARGPQSESAGGELAAGARATLNPDVAGFVSGTWRATATFGAPVRYDVAALVQSLADYPLSCLEQITSRGLPLAMLPDGAVAGPQRAARLQQAVSAVLDHQRYEGGFGLWSANDDAEPWLSPYAMEFLIRAQRAGAVVPQPAMAAGLKYLADAAQNSGGKPEDLADQAYRLYVLAFAGQGLPGAARVLAQRIDRLPTPLSRAQLGAALALAHDTPRAEAAFNAALAAPARNWWNADYGTALRDQAAIVVLLKQSGLLPDRLATLVSQLPGANLNPDALSTQEEAWSAAAAAALGRNGTPAELMLGSATRLTAPVISVALTGPETVRNLGRMAVYQSVSATGVPRVPLPAARAAMRVSRQFFALDGSPLDLSNLHQNTVFVLLLQGRADDGQDHRAMLLQGLPAGWEIAGRLAAGDVAGMTWLGKLSDTEAQPAADDRFAAVLDLTGEAPAFRVAVRLRAVTPGEYELPGAELSDMYRPGVFARQGSNRITVLGP